MLKRCNSKIKKKLNFLEINLKILGILSEIYKKCSQNIKFELIKLTAYSQFVKLLLTFKEKREGQSISYWMVSEKNLHKSNEMKNDESKKR